MIRVKLGERLLGIAFSHPMTRVSVQTLLKKHGRNPLYVRKLAELQVIEEKEFATRGVMPVKDTVPVRATLCSVFEINETRKTVELLATGRATCSILDNFDKAVGRKIALGEALQGLIMTKGSRAAIWEAYLDRDTDPLIGKIEQAMRAEMNLEEHRGNTL